MLNKVSAPALHAAAPSLSGPAAGDDDWLPRIAATDVALLNALYRHRRPIEALVAGHRVTIETAARVAPEPRARSFRLTLSGRSAHLRLSADLLELCTRSIAVGGLDHIGAVQAGMLLELALLRAIKALEARLRTDIRIEERAEAIGGTEDLVALDLLVRGLPAGDATIELFLDRQSARVIASALDELATPGAGTERLPVPIRLCAGGADLTIAELRTVRPGDIVLPDHNLERPGASVGIVGGHLCCEIERAAEGFRLASNLTSARANAAGEWFMQQPTDTLQRPSIDDAALEQLPIRVVFEMGRLDLPLTEVRRLAPGYVLPLGRPSESAVDIVANGLKVGHGSLVKIGDTIGVRVERLFSDEWV
jgi:type III secretion protein Q